MKPLNLQPIQRFSEYYFQQTRGWMQQNWMKVILLAVGTFIIIKKDINVSFSLQAAGTNEQVVQEEIYPASTKLTKNEPVQKEAKAAVKDAFGILEMASRLIRKSTKKEIVEETKPTAATSNRANDFRNLGFILNPTYAKKHRIAPEVVKEKHQNCKAYVRRFSPVASAEMHKYGIPASITLAQALLESDAGDSRLTRKNNNHFGIKCFKKDCKPGHCSNFTDDSHKDFFRQYENAWESYRSHSLFLQGKRYRYLHQLGSTDYKGWARGLKKSGYATDKKYADKLIRIIETLKLYEYDVE